MSIVNGLNCVKSKAINPVPDFRAFYTVLYMHTLSSCTLAILYSNKKIIIINSVQFSSVQFSWRSSPHHSHQKSNLYSPVTNSWKSVILFSVSKYVSYLVIQKTTISYSSHLFISRTLIYLHVSFKLISLFN